MIKSLPLAENFVVVDQDFASIVVPRNTWHTAKVSEPTQMLFVTPGQGTINAEHPERDED